MKYLVFGDVHANLVALDAVLAAGDRHRVDAYLFVGDLVGYGPEPLECLERLAPLYRDERMAWVAGNHDVVARGDCEPGGFGPEAMATLEWTIEVVRGQQWAMTFLASGHPVAKVDGGIWLTHDSLAAPGSGYYHRATQNASRELASLTAHGGRIAFYGHTHTMRGEVQAGGAVMLTPMTACEHGGKDGDPLRLGPDERAWLGTGSVGFPTKKKGAAEFLILNHADWTIEKYTVPFSREDAKRRVRAVFGPVCEAGIVDKLVKWL